MRTIGIVGGTGPASTAEYYRAFVELSQERYGGRIPRIVVNSIDSDRGAELFGLAGRGDHAALAAALLEEIGRLVAAGADLAMLASNTMHVVLEEVAAASPIPLVSIVDATRDAAARLGLHRVALFATSFTVAADIYRPAFSPHGITVVHPGAADQERIHAIYVDELLHGRFEAPSRDALLAIAEGMHHDDGVEGIILGGTELPLLLREASWHGLPFLDTGALHAAAAMAAAIDG